LGEILLAGGEEQALLYQCVKCGAIVKSTELELGVRCPYCRYRVLRKVRPPIVKRVLAR
jgi:DNA-directed RNA polymerase subunit RPC12/RpoP